MVAMLKFATVLAICFFARCEAGCSMTGTEDSPNLVECIAKYFTDGSGNSLKNTVNPFNIDAEDGVQLKNQAIAQWKAGTCEGSVGATRNGQVRNIEDGKGNCEDDTASDYERQQIKSLFGVYNKDSAGDPLIGTDGKRYTLIVTNSIPDHCYNTGAEYPLPARNYVCEHYRAILVPRSPEIDPNGFNDDSAGTYGITVSGALVYKATSVEDQCNAAMIAEKPNMDSCDGHADGEKRYHHHKQPNCVQNEAGDQYSGIGKDNPGWPLQPGNCQHLAYMRDGYKAYAKCTITYTENGETKTKDLTSCYKLKSGKNGCSAEPEDSSETAKIHYEFDEAGFNAGTCNLDRANGHTFLNDATDGTTGGESWNSGDYAYFFTDRYPYIMPGRMGAVRSGNVDLCVVSVSSALGK